MHTNLNYMRFLPLLILLIFSCSSKKDILLVQNTNNNTEFKVNFEDVKIKPDDILRIKISSKSPELSGLFSFNQNIPNNNTLESYQIEGYLVNSDGFVKIPSLNPILVKDLTLNQVSNLIENLLKEQEDIKDTTVDVKIVNAYFTILGEVNKPGRYNFLENNIDIFQALGIAGDLTINGKRNDIKIIRKNNDNLTVKNIDITSTEFLNSDSFQVYPGDIIIVNANNARVKNAGVIGNFGNLLSVLSFVLSSLILISNN